MMKEFGFLDWALLLSMVLTLAVLMAGVGLMVKGGKQNLKYGNRLMRWRIGLQGLALALFALLLICKN